MTESIDEVATEVAAGECRWNCPNMNRITSFRGWDADKVYRVCGHAFGILREAGVETPDCAMQYVEENSEQRFTHA